MDPEERTQFSRAVEELAIEGIQAHSPQAKGRVERANQTLQDRLIKEMHLQGIDTPEEANAWLPTYITDHNRHFAVKADKPEDAHVPCVGSPDKLRRILSVQEKRTLSKNLSCQYESRLYQVETQGAGLALRKADVIVHGHCDGTIELSWKGSPLKFTSLEKPLKQQPPADGKEVNVRVDKALKKRSAYVPKQDHPWGKTPPESFESGVPVVALFTHPKGVLQTAAT